MEIESNCPQCQATNVTESKDRAFIFPLEVRTIRDLVTCRQCKATFALETTVTLLSKVKLVSGEPSNDGA